MGCASGGGERERAHYLEESQHEILDGEAADATVEDAHAHGVQVTAHRHVLLTFLVDDGHLVGVRDQLVHLHLAVAEEDALRGARGERKCQAGVQGAFEPRSAGT